MIYICKLMIIGISGKMGSGKDYVCQYLINPLIQNKSYLQVSFADQIKVNVMTKCDVSFSDVYVNKTNETRTLLQQEGTERGRDIFGKDIWIKYLHNWILVYKSRGIQCFVCPDVRFKNELEYIKSQGGIVIRINAPKRNLQRLEHESGGDKNIKDILQSHISECDLDNYNYFDLIIDNDDNNLNHYKQQLENIIEKKLLYNIL